MTTIKSHSLDVLALWLAGVALACLFWTWAALTFTIEDFTDTGVGCADDCLEPAIQDEADAPISQGRNER
jgi:hypothetical protein